MAKTRARVNLGGEEHELEIPELQLQIQQANMSAEQKRLASEANQIIRRVMDGLYKGGSRRNQMIEDMRLCAHNIREAFESEELEDKQALQTANEFINEYLKIQDEQARYINVVQAWCRRMQRLAETLLDNRKLPIEKRQELTALYGMFTNVWNHYHGLRLVIENQDKILEKMKQNQVTIELLHNLERNLAEMTLAEIKLLNQIVADEELMGKTVIQSESINEVLTQVFSDDFTTGVTITLVTFTSMLAAAVTQGVITDGPMIFMFMCILAVIAYVGIVQPIAATLYNSKEYYAYLENSTGVHLTSAIESLAERLTLKS